MRFTRYVGWIHYANTLYALNIQEGGLLEVFELPSVAFMKAGVETCCQLSSSTCFLSGEKGENFTLAHFTGECEYMIDTEWTAANQVHVVGSALRTTLLNSSCDLLVDMAMVSQVENWEGI